jgi:hypothetical protein
MIDPVGEVAGRDRRRRHLDLAQRSQPQPNDPEPECRESGKDGSGRDDFDQDQAVQGSVDAAERGRDDQQLAWVLRATTGPLTRTVAGSCGGDPPPTRKSPRSRRPDVDRT